MRDKERQTEIDKAIDMRDLRTDGQKKVVHVKILVSTDEKVQKTKEQRCVTSHLIL